LSSGILFLYAIHKADILHILVDINELNYWKGGTSVLVRSNAFYS